SILAEDETVDRDREPVTILHRELPKAESAPVSTAEPDPTPELALDPAPEPTPEPVPQPTPSAALPEDDLPGLAEALNAELPVPPVAAPVAPAATTAPDPAPLPTADLAEDEPEAILARETDQDASLSVASAATSATTVEDTLPSRIPPAQPAPVAEPEEAPFAHVTDTSAFPEGDDLPSAPTARKLVIDDLDDDIPPAPPSAAMVAFASRRGAAADSAARPIDGVTRPGVSTGTSPAAKAAPTARPANGKGFAGLVTAPSIPGTRTKPKLKGNDIPRPAIGSTTTVKSPARPGGTFGSVTPAKKRTGTVFMVMVGLLLLFLALLAAWASQFSGKNVSPTEEAAAAATTEVMPGVDDEMLADMQDPEGMTDPIPEADGAATADVGDLATETLPVNIGGEEASPDLAADAAPAEALDAADLVPDPAEPEEVTAEAAPEPAPEPAPDTVVATDVSAASAPVEDQDEIFLSAMDAPPPALDALALPALVEARDVLPDPVMPPPAPGTVYRFDARGLLQPTAEGIMSPEGVFLIAGKPPLVPPVRSEAAIAAALAAVPAQETLTASASPDAASPATASSSADASLVTAGQTAPAAELPPADPAMAGFRPRPRPDGLTPAATPAAAADDAALSPEVAAEFAGLRPLSRPASVTAAAAAAAPAEAADLGAQAASLTAQAEAKLAEAAALEAQNPSIVAISMRPASRPNDFTDAVEAAVAAAVREPAPEPEVELAAAAPAPEAKPEELDEIDEPETARAAPSIPTRASVAKQATFANAINLSKINLIGTYGTDSRRYALVRQSNGKYKKVKVGDKIDGGTIKAITETEVRYQKGGRLVSLKMPKA
ncbi:MAG: hypothetical protein V4720_11045, partial [Pseudomonadota bacterium]